MTDLNAIRARLGSISDTTKRHLPPAVLKLLEVDIPALLVDVDDYQHLCKHLDKIRGKYDHTSDSQSCVQ